MLLTPLRRKLALAYMLLIAAVLALSGYFLLDYISDRFVDALVRDLSVRSGLIREMVRADWPWPDAETGDAIARRLGAGAAARVTVIGLDGRVLAESEQPSRAMADHSDRPEFREALAGQVGQSQRLSDTRAERMLYIAVPPAPGLPAVVRLAVNVEWIWQQIVVIRTGLAVALGGGLLIAGLAGLGLGAWLLTGPLSRVVQGARRFVAGDLTSPITVQTGDEWEVLATALNSMATSLDEQLQSVGAERSRVRTILEELPEGVLLLNAAGTLRMANRKARRWLALPDSLGDYRFGPEGATPAAAGSSRDALSVLGRTPQLREFVSTALSATSEQHTVTMLRTPAPVHVAISSFKPGGTDDILIVMHDISEIRRLEGARRELVANVSHELKTPIGAIRVLAESLAGDEEPESAPTAEFLARIISETERLSLLVDEMLYLSRLEAAQQPPDRVATDLPALVHRAVQAIAPFATAKDVEVEVEVLAQAKLAAECDPAQVERAVLSLLDNAVKFSPGGRKVLVRVLAEPGAARVEVEDRGPGIAEADLVRVWERFFKAEPSRQGSGSGLGLAIVKHIVQAHRGQVFARSTLGQGSTFGFTIPRENRD